MASWSCIAVLVVGNFSGATVKGITGFGSAILNLCVWVGFKCIGVDAGTLQQAVVSECLCSEAVAVPLLVMTKARTTCDWRLVTSLAIFGAIGAPIGAALLANLQPAYVEFVMACVILLVIMMHCRVLQKLALCCSNKTSHQTSIGQLSNSCQAGQQQKQGTLDSCSNPASHAGVAHATAHEQSPMSVSVTSDQSLQADVCDCVTESGAMPCEQLQTIGKPLLSALHSSGSTSKTCLSLETDTGAISSSKSSSCSLAAAAMPMAMADNRPQCMLQEQASGAGPVYEELEDDDEEPLLPHHQSVMIDAAPAHVSCIIDPPQLPSTPQCSPGFVARATHSLVGCRAAVTEWWAFSTSPQQRDVIVRTMLIGSAAGTAAGIMSGMTGMGGPAMMYMYSKLNVPKDTVRGSNAVLGILQFRIIAYAVMGAFVPEDWRLYTSCIAAGMIGMFIGDKLAARMNQQAFSQIMVFLMVLCCVLLFASSAGLTSG